MKLVLFVHQGGTAWQTLKNYLPEEYTFLENTTGDRAHRALKKMIAGIVMVDTSCPQASTWVQEAFRTRPDLTYVAVSGAENQEYKPPPSGCFYDFLFPPFTAWKVKTLLNRACERVTFSFERNSLQDNTRGNSMTNANVERTNRPEVFRRKERVLCDFSRALSSNFNQSKLLDLFIHAVAELMPVGKLSILLEHEYSDKYVVAAQKGLDPALCSKLSFKPGEGIASWLAAEGCILYAHGMQGSAPGIYSSEVLQEMKILQAVICIPLLVQGRLKGILTLGPKVTGASFYEEELEILYVLSGNLALALQDIELHHQLRNQKLYHESILLRMNSGVLAINDEGLITTFNCRAGEILDLEPEKILGRDLRFLPGPLGDLLYETFSLGEPYYKREIELVRGRVPLEISTYQLINEKGRVFGSVLILDDISERKKFERERRQADQLHILHKFVEQLAHEIKNPMVAIQTFSELLPEKYDDSFFRGSFTHTVGQEIRKLNDLVEQLIAFSTPLSYKFAPIDIHEILDASLLLLQEQGRGRNVDINSSFCTECLPVKADKNLLARAFSYLLRNSFLALERKGAIFIRTTFDQTLFRQGGVRLEFFDPQTLADPQEVEMIFIPLCERQDCCLSLGLPVSRKIIEDHGGRVEASLTKERSLRFEVCLPVFMAERGEELC